MSCNDEYKLNPCPFCGGEATLGAVCPDIYARFYIFCKNCLVATDLYFDAKKAREHWNRRVGEAE